MHACKVRAQDLAEDVLPGFMKSAQLLCMPFANTCMRCHKTASIVQLVAMHSAPLQAPC